MVTFERVATLLLALGLAGCASISEMRRGEPAFSASTSKSSQQVSRCILSGWQEKSARYGDVYLQPLGEGFSVLSAGNVEVADITPIASGTDIKFYHKSGIFSYRTDARVDVIKHCI
ncbi:hypothetical protein [Rahnella variigena]|jgi:hypothetical protein|uniref:hypothetical protein n=1 Tax=Rahnella variigena TaxID=574964 RepID=UPI00244C0386|nr:hypothetical protein [Rahnella variigena]MDH2898051.1 hypothetical protein [Rahnella variigena]